MTASISPQDLTKFSSLVDRICTYHLGRQGLETAREIDRLRGVALGMDRGESPLTSEHRAIRDVLGLFAENFKATEGQRLFSARDTFSAGGAGPIQGLTVTGSGLSIQTDTCDRAVIFCPWLPDLSQDTLTGFLYDLASAALLIHGRRETPPRQSGTKAIVCFVAPNPVIPQGSGPLSSVAIYAFERSQLAGLYPEFRTRFLFDQGTPPPTQPQQPPTQPQQPPTQPPAQGSQSSTDGILTAILSELRSLRKGVEALGDLISQMGMGGSYSDGDGPSGYPIYPLHSFSSFDWAANGFTVTEEDDDGPTHVAYEKRSYTRRNSSNKFGDAIWYSRSIGKDPDTGTPLYSTAIKFRRSTPVDPISERNKRP